MLVPEGASDTAAALPLGLAVVGRPSATGGLKDLVELLNGFPADRDIIVVGEMDAKTDGSWPGRNAAVQMAEKLTAALHRPVKWCLPPDIGFQGPAGRVRVAIAARTPFGRRRWLRIGVLQTDYANSLENPENRHMPFARATIATNAFSGFQALSDLQTPSTRQRARQRH